MTELSVPSANGLALSEAAALALLDDAERALETTHTREEADNLWRKVRAVEEAARLARVADATVAGFARVRLRAQRKYGELLGPPENHGPATVTRSNGSAERVSQHRARQIADVPDPVFEAFLEQEEPDKLSAASLVREGRKATRPEPTPVEIPTGTYSVLYADPPWRYDDVRTESRAVENQYPTMSLDEIKSLPVPAADDAVLFMWATSPKLAEAFEVLAAWAFTYRTCAVWVKDRIGMGYYFRQRHELLLVAKRGNVPAPLEAARADSVIEAPRGRHSEKPARVYSLIEAMYPDLPRVELFARGARPGWSAWGNEAVAA